MIFFKSLDPSTYTFIEKESHRSEEIKCPEFGEAIGNPHALNNKQVASRIAIIAAAVLAQVQ